MPLVKCPDCGKSISDLAPSCIGCGRPMVVAIQQPLPARSQRLTQGPPIDTQVQTSGAGAEQFYVRGRDGKDRGPFSAAELRAQYRQGRFTSLDWVRRGNSTEYEDPSRVLGDLTAPTRYAIEGSPLSKQLSVEELRQAISGGKMKYSDRVRAEHTSEWIDLYQLLLNLGSSPGQESSPSLQPTRPATPPKPSAPTDVPRLLRSELPSGQTLVLPQQSAHVVVGDDLLDASLGDKNSEYYRVRFRVFKGSDSAFNPKWNWAAFFAPVIWALYRKMYGWFSVLVVYFGFNKLIAELDSSGVSLVLYELVPSLFFGTFGNYLYFKTINNRIAMARASVSEESTLVEHLRRKGGVLTWVPWAFVALVLVGIVAAIVIPSLLRSKN